MSKAKEVNQVKQLKLEVKNLKDALANATVMNLLNEQFLKIACTRLQTTPEELKKKSGINVPLV